MKKSAESFSPSTVQSGSRAGRLKAAALAGALTLVLAMSVPGPQAAFAQANQQSKSILHSLQDAFVQVADELEPAVVTITAKKTVRPKPKSDDPAFEDLNTDKNKGRSYRSQGTGSGVIISTDGWIITNDHVVGGADKVTVKLHDGREFDGVVKRDYRSDIALIKVEASSLPAARLGDSDKVRTGQWAIAIGSPFRYEGSFSVGVISSLGRRQEIKDHSGEGDSRLYPDMIQTDAAINPGNSGGPLVNIDGEVIGINTAIESDAGNSVGIGFAIPMNSVKFVVDQLKEKGRVSYGYLGVEPDTLSPKLADIYKVAAGALVKAEPPVGSPAAKAGIHVDDVITEIYGKPIRSEADFRTTVSRIAPGTAINVMLVRGGEEKQVKAVVSEPPPPKVARVEAGPPHVVLGVDVGSLTAEQAMRVGLTGPMTGVVVRAVDSASSIAETEMQAGDVILKVNGIPTPNLDAFKKVTEKLHPGDIVRIIFAGRRSPETVKKVAIFTLD
jgi:serine protease Do